MCSYLTNECAHIIILFLFLAAEHLYDVTWRRINNNNSLEFTCEVACRTSRISGCSVVLSNPPGGSGTSIVVNGSIEDIRPRFVTAVINNVDPMRSYMYSASALVIVNKTSISSKLIRRIIPALIISPTTCKSMNVMHCILYMHIKISISYITFNTLPRHKFYVSLQSWIQIF